MTEQDTVVLTKEAGAPADPAVRRRSRSALARSAARDRSLVVLIGLVLLAAGVLVALLSYGVFGVPRASRPLLDPMIVDALRAQPLAARITAIVVGALLALLGLLWAAGSVRPERRPDLVLEAGAETSIVVSSGAAADAVATEARRLPGVAKARARLVGPATAPALRVTLWLADDADVAQVLRRFDDEVLGTARESLGITTLPVGVLLDLDAPTRAPRVT
ncbi:alkaline shock response membrane anchor protein AmaP [Pseudonocardia sp. TRM90224]|uniref:alkaline shock response membrane anchor protein AmaP n=1 Tax=Pseudonocardia sp. TRM90224 TaxID=2812678 RepID=UPI001E4B58B0|nr:alkaline shock response membrane anchor protein AmaP [Pseudonocardia sp. TRM90224]